MFYNKIVLSLYQQNKYIMVTTTINPIKTKRLFWGKKGKEVSGWLKLEDGTKTHFFIDKDGTWEQWGNTRDNLTKSIPFLHDLTTFLLCGE